MAQTYQSAFLEYCANPQSTTTLEVRLFDVPVDMTVPHVLGDFHEVYFSGYRRASNEVFNLRQLIAPNSGIAQTGLLNWVCAFTFGTAIVAGHFIVMNVASVAQLLAFEQYDQPVPMNQAGQRLGKIITVRNLIAILS